MTYSNDWHKVILAELNPGICLNGAIWNFYDTVGDTYYTDFGYGEINNVTVEGIELTSKTSIAECQANAGSYFYDFWNQKLYIHLTDGGDPSETLSGGDYVYKVIAFFILCFCNGQYQGSDILDFIPEGFVHPCYYEPWMSEDSIESLSASVDDHYDSAMEVQFGSISLTNSAWWYSVRKVYLWNNKDIKVKVGTKGDLYADFETIFVGKVSNPRVTDENTYFELVDSRIGVLRSIPVKRYNLTDYPDMDEEQIDRPVPILFGQVENITPVCIDTVNFIYKWSDTVFNSVTYAMQSLDAVRKSDVLLFVATDYTVDLNAGTFTLLVDPGDDLISCDAKGIKNGFDMSTGLKDGSYSENVSDHLYFILNVLNEIPVAKIDLASFSELKNARTQKIVLYLDTDTTTLDANRLFQRSAIYHFLPLLNGNFAARYYRRNIPTGTLELRYYNYEGFGMFDQGENVFRDIVIYYDKDPTTGIYKTVSATNEEVEWKYSEKKLFEVETALRDTAEAESLRSFYQTLLNAPADKLETSISLEGRNLLPTDKLIVSRTIESDAGFQTILEEEVYVILGTRKDLAAGKVEIVAQLDSQLAIYAVHADSDHQDEHGDHNDAVHSDAAHSDSHTDTHSDLYTNNAPTHDEHSDGYLNHTDAPRHTDVHNDEYYNHAHGDSYSQTHGDVAHQDSDHSDHDDTVHTDTHEDVSHIDSEV